MSTATHEKYAKKAKSEPTVELIAKFRSYRVILEHNEDSYTPQGGLRTTNKGRLLRFNNGRCACPESWMDEVMAHPDYGTTFWVKGDPTGTQAKGGPQVVHGGMTTDMAYGGGAPTEPPIPEWDELGARDIRPLVKSGRVDLEVALLWEFTHRNRQQVIEAIRKAKADEPEAEESADTEAGDEAGFVQPTPED